MPLPHFAYNLKLKFKDEQAVFYTGTLPHVEATVFDSGSTMTAIMIFSPEYDEGRPNIITVDNNDLIDRDEYISNRRDQNIDNIISDEQ